jgi:hypothetical protein
MWPTSLTATKRGQRDESVCCAPPALGQPLPGRRLRNGCRLTRKRPKPPRMTKGRSSKERWFNHYDITSSDHTLVTATVASARPTRCCRWPARVASEICDSRNARAFNRTARSLTSGLDLVLTGLPPAHTCHNDPELTRRLKAPGPWPTLVQANLRAPRGYHADLQPHPQ